MHALIDIINCSYTVLDKVKCLAKSSAADAVHYETRYVLHNLYRVLTQ